MICDKLTASNVLNAISEVMTMAKKKYKEDSPERLDAQRAMNRVRAAVASEVRLDDLFEQNLNNTSQLDVVVAAEPIVNAIQENLQDWMRKMVSGSTIRDYDTFIDRLDQTGKGFQSVVELLFTKGKDGYKLDKHVAKAIGIVGADWLANKLEPELAEHRTDDAIKTMLGLDRKEIVTPDMREEVNQFDAMYAHSVNRMGSQIYQLLGLKAKKGGDHIAGKQIEATMKTELGILAMKAMEKAGIVTTGLASYMINGTKYEDVHVVKANKAYDKNGDALIVVNGQSVKGKAKTLDKLNKDAAGTEARRGVYTSRLLAVPTDDEIVNEGITGMLGNVVSEDHKTADKKQSGTGNQIRKGYGIAVAKLANDGTLQKAMGFVPESDTIDVLKPSSRGRNRQIEETIDYLQEAIKEFGYDTTLFAKWKVITNNRFMIDSNELNWQDKKLHRFAVTPTETSDGKPISILVNTEGKHRLFHMALAQAFDLPIDKRTAAIILNGGKVLGKNEKSIYDVVKEVNKAAGIASKEELVAAGITSVDQYLDDTMFTDQVGKAFALVTSKYNKSEPEHALSGVVELLKYNVAMALEEEFRTEALIETDAITSGYGIKNMQMPVIVDKNGNVDKEATLAELEKVGVFDVTEKKNGVESVPASYGERVQNGKLDSYQDPAQGVAKRIAKEKIDVPRALMDIVDPKAIYDEGGKLVSLSRAFMKNPFMVLNYGAGVSTINRAITRNAINNLYEMVNEMHQFSNMSSKEQTAAEDRMNELEATVAEVLKLIGVGSEEIKTRLGMSKLGKFKLSSGEIDSIYAKLMPAGEDETQTIGNAVESEFEEKYGHFIKLVKLTNETLTMQFKVAKEMLDQKIKDRFKDLTEKYGNAQLVPPISREEMMTMVQELKDVFPVLDSALKMADGKPAPILIVKKKAVTSKDATVELLGNTTATGAVKHASSTVFGKEHRTVTNAAIEVYKLVEAYSSGAVVPIHFFDGGVQAKVLSEYTALGVHDANFFTLDDVVNGTRFYNENWYEMNKSYSLMDSMMKAFNGTFGKDSKALRDAIEAVVGNPVNNGKDIDGNTVTFLDGVIAKSKELEAAMKKVNAGREFVYSRDLRIEHSYFPEVGGDSAAYEGKQGGLKTGKEKLGSGLNEMVKDGFAEKMTGVAEQAEKDRIKDIPTEETVDGQGNSRRGTDKQFTDHTGGATGADQIWAGLLGRYGVQSKHYRPYAESKSKYGSPKYVGKVKNIKGATVIEVTKKEQDNGMKLNKALGNRTHQLNNRNYVQVANADVVYAVAPIVNNRVEGGTGSATRMAEAMGKPVYVLNTKDVKWYKQNGEGKYTEAVPEDIPHNAAFVGTRDIAEKWVRKNNKPIKVPALKNTATITMAMAKFINSQADELKKGEIVKTQREGSGTDNSGKTKVVTINGLTYKTPDTVTAINTMRRYGKQNENKHYGNPFGTKTYGDKAEVPTQLDDKGVSILYAKWLLGSSSEGYKQWLKDNGVNDVVGSVTTKQLKGLEERKQFIVDSILAGKLDGKELMYFRDTGKLNHAKVLAELVNNRSKYFEDRLVKLSNDIIQAQKNATDNTNENNEKCREG